MCMYMCVYIHIHIHICIERDITMIVIQVKFLNSNPEDRAMEQAIRNLHEQPEKPKSSGRRRSWQGL